MPGPGLSVALLDSEAGFFGGIRSDLTGGFMGGRNLSPYRDKYSIVGVAVLSLLLFQGCPPVYKPITLPGSWVSSPLRINEYVPSAKRLQAAGSYKCLFSVESPSCAILWELTNFPTSPFTETFDLNGLAHANESVALGLNNIYPSHVVGWTAGGGTSPRQAIRWQKSGVTTLPTLGGPGAEAWAVDDGGHVVGWSQNPTGQWRACLWTNNSPQDLGTLGGAQSQAVAMNSAGQVVGWAEESTGSRHAFLWTPGGTDGVAANPQMRDLHLAHVPTSKTTIESFQTSTAIGINDGGHVVGELSGTVLYGFLWSSARGTVALDRGSSAHGINKDDVIVGFWQPAPGQQQNAVEWNNKLQMLDLNTMIDSSFGLHLWTADAINSHLDIICRGSQPSSSPVFVAIVLTPTN
jgi:probable HAF family extracellular repeat protein